MFKIWFWTTFLFDSFKTFFHALSYTFTVKAKDEANNLAYTPMDLSVHTDLPQLRYMPEVISFFIRKFSHFRKLNMWHSRKRFLTYFPRLLVHLQNYMHYLHSFLQNSIINNFKEIIPSLITFIPWFQMRRLMSSWW